MISYLFLSHILQLGSKILPQCRGDGHNLASLVTRPKCEDLSLSLSLSLFLSNSRSVSLTLSISLCLSLSLSLSLYLSVHLSVSLSLSLGSQPWVSSCLSFVIRLDLVCSCFVHTTP